MRLVHLADLHLGIRQFTRLTPGGLNQREADVSATFARVIDQVIGCAPDLVMIAGDVFHMVRPSNHTITQAFTQLSRLRNALPQTTVVMIAGNHETPRTGELGCILPLFTAIPRVYVVDGEAQRIRLGSLSITCVPERVAHLTALAPDPTAERSILLLHGEVAGAIPGLKPSAVAIEAERWGADWDYVALGHYHVTQQVAPCAWYAGAMDYTSSDPWRERRSEAEAGYAGKGFLEVDLDTGTVTRHEIVPSRRWIDLPRIDGRDLSAESLDAQIAAHMAAAGDITGAVIRQVVTDVPRDREAEMQSSRRAEWIKAALSFTVDVRRPEVQRRIIGVSPAKRRQNLAELLAEKIGGLSLPPELDQERDLLLALGARYLGEADASLEAKGVVALPISHEEAA